MKTKRLIAMLLAVMMVLSLIPVAAFAEPAHTHNFVYTAEGATITAKCICTYPDACDEDLDKDPVSFVDATAELEYEIKLEPTSDVWFDYNSAGVITKFNPGERDDAPTDIVIPATVGGTPVTGIGEWSFQDAEITSVVIPEGVTAISHDAFTFCSCLKSVVIPESVTFIGNDAFSFCGALESVTIPSSVTDIGAGAFQYCAAVESLVIPEGVTTIGGSAFIYCESLESVTFLGQPAAVGGEDQNAFEGVGDCVPCTLNLPATWTGDPAVGTNASWQGGSFTVVKAVPEVSALEKAQTAALAELGKLNPVSDVAKAFIADAMKAIEAAISPEEVSEIVTKAKEDVAAEAAELAKAKKDAAAAINALAGNAPSEAVKSIVDKALGDIENAESIEAVNGIKEQALADVAAQQEAEKPTQKSWLDILLEMLDQYLPTVGKFTRSVINATMKAIKDTAVLTNYLEKLFDIIF